MTFNTAQISCSPGGWPGGWLAGWVAGWWDFETRDQLKLRLELINFRAIAGLGVSLSQTRPGHGLHRHVSKSMLTQTG